MQKIESINEKIEKIKDKIEKIRNSDFQVKDLRFYYENHKMSWLLRQALVCNNAIGSIFNEAKETALELYKELDDVMKSKLRELNPGFDDETLNRMISSYKRGYIVFPMDIFVLDDAVLHKEAIADDFGDIYNIKTFMFEGMRPYYNVEDLAFTSYYVDILSSKDIDVLSREENIYTSKFLSDNINNMFGANIVRPIYELNTDTHKYGYDGLTSGQISGINVYINMNFYDLGKSIKEKRDCDIKVCIQNGEDITIYYVHQLFVNGEPVWNVERTENEVWRLTEEALKFEKSGMNRSLKMGSTSNKEN